MQVTRVGEVGEADSLFGFILSRNRQRQFCGGAKCGVVASGLWSFVINFLIYLPGTFSVFSNQV